MAEIKVGDKVRVAERARTLDGHCVDPDFFGKEGVVDGFHDKGDVSVYLEDLDYSQYIAPFYLTLIEEISEASFKVGYYFTEESGDIVWKVTEVGEDGRLLTEALLIQVADDLVDVIHLAPDSVSPMKKATPEQIEAFENHPYWGKQVPVADAISPSVYQFPNGVEVRDISAHLSSFGGQAVQYIARATRLDGVVKGLPVQDLKKAIQLLEWEVERLEAGK